MHVRAAGGIAKGIDDFLAREPDPAAVVRVLPVIDRAPADARGLEALLSSDDALGDLWNEELRILRILPRAEAAHRGGCAVRVRGADHHAINGDAALLRRERLRLVDELLLHHAGIDDGEGDLHLPIVEHDGARVQRARQLVAPAFEKSASDDARKCRG
jgi:hypothetical protein